MDCFINQLTVLKSIFGLFDVFYEIFTKYTVQQEQGVKITILRSEAIINQIEVLFLIPWLHTLKFFHHQTNIQILHWEQESTEGHFDHSC